jgi:hypothetical protein
MTATNHVIAGALIANLVKQPFLAVPLALVSHIFMDALPHFGWKEHTSGTFAKILFADMFCAGLVLLALVAWHPDNWLLMTACGIVAASPDLLWLYYLMYELRAEPKPHGPLAHFLARIQWSETITPGLPIEFGWLVSTGAVLLVTIRQ